MRSNRLVYLQSNFTGGHLLAPFCEGEGRLRREALYLKWVSLDEVRQFLEEVRLSVLMELQKL